MMPDSSSLAKIAAMVGVSSMTVSRVLRNSPRVAPATRERVLAAARSLNYVPDPHLARMMHLVRNRKPVHQHGVIAVVRDYVPDDALLSPSYKYVPLEDMRRRAKNYGYDVEEFQLGRDRLTPKRLQEILHARGTEGVIVSPQSIALPCGQLDYGPFASVSIGFAMRDPVLHIASINMNLGIQRTAAELAGRGYQRIGVAVPHWADFRVQNGFNSGMVCFQQTLPLKQRIPVLLMPHNDEARNAGVFSKWMKTYRPDVVIASTTCAPGWLDAMGFQIPSDVGFVSYDWGEEMSGYAGIWHRRDHVASAAIDIVVAQLYNNERGLPSVPRQILLPTHWVDGPSIRKAPAAQSAPETAGKGKVARRRAKAEVGKRG
jgi:LacI family transcriptional regulator